MSRAVAVRLGAFAGALALAFGGAFAIGTATDPIAAAEPAAHGGGAHGGHGEADGPPAGLAVSQDGYTLRPESTFFQPSRPTTLRFTVQGPDGRPVTRYTPTHERDLHLIAVRRDLSGFHHLHPALGADGTWSVPFTFTAAGTWRLYADFQPAALDEPLTLGTDVNVSGLNIPVPLNDPASTTSFDGYDVTLAGDPRPGRESRLTFGITRGSRPIADLQPYLGAFGHLVSLREGDLAYLHNHPAEHAEPGRWGGPWIVFDTTFPTAGRYALFLDFLHAGAVHTAEFTVVVDGDGTAIVPPAPQPGQPGVPDPDDGHQHSGDDSHGH